MLHKPEFDDWEVRERLACHIKGRRMRGKLGRGSRIKGPSYSFDPEYVFHLKQLGGLEPQRVTDPILRDQALRPWVYFYWVREIRHAAEWGRTKLGWLQDSVRQLRLLYEIEFTTPTELEQELLRLADRDHRELVDFDFMFIRLRPTRTRGP